MDVLLINPASSIIEKSFAYRLFLTPIAPLNLAYIASVLAQDGIKVAIADQYASRLSHQELLAFIAKEKPAIVGISFLTSVFPDVKALCAGIRKSAPAAKIVLGNIHPTCFPEDTLKSCSADIVVRGEGEMTMRHLCQQLLNNKPLTDVRGITFLQGATVVHNPDREPIANLDELPFPAWHLLDLDKYKDVPQAAIRGMRAFPILASRGCTHHCYYCSQDKIYTNLRYRNLHKVVEEMDYFNRTLEIKMFGFNDAYFPWDEARGLEFCDLLMRQGLHKRVRWCTETRVDKVTPRLLAQMKKAGVHLIMYGIEVGDEKILRSISKNTTVGQARDAVRETKKEGIRTLGLYMLGLPHETVATCKATIQLAKELDCDISKFNIAVPYPGSRFFNDYHKTRALDKPELFSSWIDWTGESGDLVFVPEGMESSTLRHLQRRAMLEFYLRPAVIARHLFGRMTTMRSLVFGGIWLTMLFFQSLFRSSRHPAKKNEIKEAAPQ